jgi:hypothetical protein
MAMSPSGLAEAIFAKMGAEYWPDTPLSGQAESETKKYYTVLSTAILDYIKQNADILPGTFNVPTQYGGPVLGLGKVV